MTSNPSAKRLVVSKRSGLDSLGAAVAAAAAERGDDNASVGNMSFHHTRFAPGRGDYTFTSLLPRGDGRVQGIKSALVNYAFALLLLAAFALVHAFQAQDFKLLGIAVGVTIVVLDGCTALLYRANVLRSPGTIIFMLGLCRLVLILYGSRRWLLGFSSVYVIYGIAMANLIAQRWVSTYRPGDDIARIERETYDIETRRHENRKAREAERRRRASIAHKKAARGSTKSVGKGTPARVPNADSKEEPGVAAGGSGRPGSSQSNEWETRSTQLGPGALARAGGGGGGGAGSVRSHNRGMQRHDTAATGFTFNTLRTDFTEMTYQPEKPEGRPITELILGPEVVLTIVTLAFITLLLVVFLTPISLDKVSMFTKEHEQYEV